MYLVLASSQLSNTKSFYMLNQAGCPLRPVFTACCGLSECEGLIRDRERLNSLKSKMEQPKHTGALCCWGQLFVFPQLLSEISHSFHQREPCFPAGTHYGPWRDTREGRLSRGKLYPLQHTHPYTPLSVLFTLQQLSSTSSSLFDSFWTFNIARQRPGHGGVPFELLLLQPA